MSSGWNPVTGRDPSGGRPAFAPAGAPVPSQGQPYIPHVEGPGYGFSQPFAPMNPYPNMAYGMPAMGTQPIQGMQGYPMPSYNPYMALYPHSYPMPPQTAMGSFHTQQTIAVQPNGTGNIFPRQPQPCPSIDTAMPAAQMTNSSGGVGCEPGYNYFFAAEHAKVHIFKSDKPPWQLPENAQIPFIASHIPCQTQLGDLLKGFGCYNPNPKKNKCFEIISGGNGKWYKGFNFNGEDKDTLKMTIGEIGWDSTRTGQINEKPVVCLWFCKS
ncbi:Fc.00g027170.m01.CDS01 [Cosmosporella sp. VM-42]